MKEHVARANYQTKIWKSALIQISENPNPWDGHGWKEAGEPLWCDNNMILPESLVDILACSEEVNSDDSDDEMELEETYMEQSSSSEEDD